MYKRLLDFLNKNDILVNNQFEFREKHSTYMAILDLVDKIAASGGNKKTAAGWKRPKECPRATWTRSVENDLVPLNIGFHSNLRKAQDRSCWR